MSVRAFASLEWKPAPMPGSNGPVSLASLPDPGDHGFRAFVRFPPGWERPGAGHYAVPEEFLVLEGELAIGDFVWRAGSYAWIPACSERSATRSPTGCLVFAWFGGPARWVAGRAALPDCGASERWAHWREAPRRARRDGALIRQLRAGPEHSTWAVEPGLDAARELLVDGFEFLNLDDYRWRVGQPSTAEVTSRGAWLVRGNTLRA